MSDDLVKRLRWAADNSNLCGEWNCNPDDLDSAADEITRLRAEVAKRDALMEAGFAEYERRLAKAAEALSLYSCEDGCNDCPLNERDRVSCGWTARAALSDDKGVA